MKYQVGKKYLITTDNWFTAPNGSHCKAVFGTLNSIRHAEDSLGIKTNVRSATWFLEIGNMVVAGCQIHYIIQTDKCNKEDHINDWSASAADGLNKYQSPTRIYFADEDYSGNIK